MKCIIWGHLTQHLRICILSAFFWFLALHKCGASFFLNPTVVAHIQTHIVCHLEVGYESSKRSINTLSPISVCGKSQACDLQAYFWQMDCPACRCLIDSFLSMCYRLQAAGLYFLLVPSMFLSLAAGNFFYKTCNNPAFHLKRYWKKKAVLSKAQSKQYKWKHEFSQSLWLFSLKLTHLL